MSKVNQTKGIGREVRLCLVLALSVILMLANFGIIGRFGAAMSDALFGCFGLLAYVLPVFLFFGYAFFIANIGNPLIFRKILGAFMLFCFAAAFAQLLSLGISRTTPILDFYKISAEDHNGGGIVGGSIAWVFSWGIGKIGAYVLTIAGLVISSIVMTQKPLLSQLGSRSRHAAKKAREKRLSRLEENNRQLEEESRLWEEKEQERQEAEELRKNIRRAEEERRRLAAERKRQAENKKKAKKKSRRPSSEDRISHREKSYDASREINSGAYPDVLTGPISEADNPLAYVTLTPPEERPERRRQNRPAENTGAAPVLRPETPDLMSWTPNPEPAVTLNPPLQEEPEPAAFTMPSFLQNQNQPEVSAAEPAADFFEEEPAAVYEDEAVAPTPEEMRQAASARSASGTSGTKTASKSTAGGTENAGAVDGGSAAGAKRSTKKQTAGVEDVGVIQAEIEKAQPAAPVYRLPDVSLLTKGKPTRAESQQTLMATAAKLQKTLADFGVNARVINVTCGPTVTRYELQPEQGVKVARILNLQDDIKLNLAASEIRIEAPIPGKAAVGIEVPNKETSAVMLRDIIESPEFQKSRASLAFAVGKDIAGKCVVEDIEKMPHLLIAGATGSGKSVCLNTLIMSILFKSKPDEVKLLMIDPKVVELKIYDGIPHLLIPVVTDAKKAAGALNWAVQEMTDRYNKFAQINGIRNIQSYNKYIEETNAELDEAHKLPKMPRLVVIVDELADLMMVASKEVEEAICRLAQLARAAGIHLIIATQRPSVNVVTGLIKANMPSRAALAVTSSIDSRTILDMHGAEKLLGHGDMLFKPQAYPKPVRVQGAYISDSDITEVVKFLVLQTNNVEYNKEIEDQIDGSVSAVQQAAPAQSDGRDEYFAESGRLIISKEKASIGMLQRAFKIGFNRAARIMDQLAEAGVVGGEEGTKPRRILMKMDEFEQLLQETDA
ncbi:MAG: DNA translocase FtsK [Lachnospiraceae bacterium]|nr:DNA translocase FtsK [Lachnospiraceae bacterium]